MSLLSSVGGEIVERRASGAKCRGARTRGRALPAAAAYGLPYIASKEYPPGLEWVSLVQAFH
jgi:hypothetical protein